MLRRVSVSAAVAGLLLAASSEAVAAPSAADAMRSAQYLVGTWSCAHTVGDFSGTYTEMFATALDGQWLKQTYEFPATSTEPAVHAEYFIEYDARVPRWVRFGAHSNGQYYGQYSNADRTSGWDWDYVLPSRNGTSSKWTKVSDAQYTIDGPQYSQNGKTVTEHHICKKTA